MEQSSDRVSYGIGVVHGLAGSGSPAVLVMTQIDAITSSLMVLAGFRHRLYRRHDAGSRHPFFEKTYPLDAVADNTDLCVFHPVFRIRMLCKLRKFICLKYSLENGKTGKS
jgi:hypothetical protein